MAKSKSRTPPDSESVSDGLTRHIARPRTTADGLPTTDADEPMTFTVEYRTIESVCDGPGCTVVIRQPDRPGRKRRYHNDACRQAAFRARKRQPDAEHAAWIRALDSRNTGA